MLSFVRSKSFKIYLCHTFSSWGDRMWGWAVGIYMVILFPESLLLTAIYGFANCLSGIIFAPYIGRWIDTTERITAARNSVLIQNFAVVLDASILTATLIYHEEIKGASFQYAVYAAVIIVAIFADLASVANKIALEKDWIVVLSGGDEKELAKLNSIMRTINLTTHILAPVVVGQIITFISAVAGSIFIAVWNVVSAVIEYSLLKDIYNLAPELGSKEVLTTKTEPNAHAEVPWLARDAWRKYFSHHVLSAGIGLGCLYMTVLGFDSITTGFVYSQGVSESFIGVFTAVGAVFGILGSITFPILRDKIGKNPTGILGFSLETLTLLPCVASVFVFGSPFEWISIEDKIIFKGTSASNSSGRSYSVMEIVENEPHVILLMLGIILARYGLWLADLTVTQTFQEGIEEAQRGVINGVQDSINKFMDLCKFTLVILYPATESFGYLIFTSWVFTLAGTLCFIVFSRKDRMRKSTQSNQSGAVPVVTTNPNDKRNSEEINPDKTLSEPEYVLRALYS